MRLRGVTSAAPLAVIASALGEIAPLGLEPVVHWERDECYLVNVWERMSS